MIQLGIIKGEHFMHQEPPMQMEKTITVDEEILKYFALLRKGDSNKIIELFETGYSPVFYPFVMTEDTTFGLRR